MLSLTITAPATATTVKDLMRLNGQVTARQITLQTPASNAASVFFGGKSTQDHELQPDTNGTVLERDPATLWVRGNGSDVIALGVVVED
jgi:hypothetical protein